MRSYLEKLKDLCRRWEQSTAENDRRSTDAVNQVDSMAGVEAFVNSLEASNAMKSDKTPDRGRSTELTNMVNSFDREELSDFLSDYLHEHPQLMALPLFSNSKIVTKEEMAFDWLMDLPHQTAMKAVDIYEWLLEEALTEKGEPKVKDKIFAFVKKNRNGLSLQFLRDKIESDNEALQREDTDALLSARDKLQLAILMINHEDYDLDYQTAQEVLQIWPRQIYLLPALIEAFLIDRENGVHHALRLLNKIEDQELPTKILDIREDMLYMFVEIGRNYRKQYPSDWQRRLQQFAQQELQLKNTWIRNLMEEALPMLSLANVNDLSRGEEKNDPEIPAIKDISIHISLDAPLSKEDINGLVTVAFESESHREILMDAFVLALQEQVEYGAARHAKPLLYALKDQGLDVEGILLNKGIKVTLFPYTIDAVFMHPYREGEEWLFSDSESAAVQQQLADFIRESERFDNARIEQLREEALKMAEMLN